MHRARGYVHVMMAATAAGTRWNVASPCGAYSSVRWSVVRRCGRGRLFVVTCDIADGGQATLQVTVPGTVYLHVPLYDDL